MTLATPYVRTSMLELLPPWVVNVGTAAGGLIGTVLLTRSVAKRRVQEAIDNATARLEDSNRSMMDSQARELGQLRTEVGNLRNQVSGLTAINTSYVKALAEKDLQLAELQSDLRVKTERIHHLESLLAQAN